MGYLFEHGWERERERLAAIERSDAGSVACLEAIGVAPGWHCLEVGAGAGSIARWLCGRVLPSGRVVATDLEVKMLDELALPGLEVRRHDLRTDPLESDSFDLVHARKVLEHLPDPAPALHRMVSAARPGGFVFVEDADLVSLTHVTGMDPDAFRRGYDAFLGSMADAGYQPRLGLELGDRLRAEGLLEVQVRGQAGEWTGAGPSPSVYLLTFTKLRDRVVVDGRLTAREADAFLAGIQAPGFRAITAIHFMAWGRKPERGKDE